jgi:hypothetical protein
MNKIEEIKKDILQDYAEFAELAMMGMNDTMNLKEIAINNFELKINELIKICKDD